MSTLAVCGVAALVVPPAAVASATMDAPAVAAAPDRTQPETGWTAELILTDPNDSDDGDDDGGDDAPTASAVVPTGHQANRGFDRSWLLGHVVLVSKASQVIDGHALRGPPSISGHVPDLDRNHDYFDPLFPPPVPASRPRPRPIFRSQLDHARCPAFDAQSLRAP